MDTLSNYSPLPSFTRLFFFRKKPIYDSNNNSSLSIDRKIHAYHPLQWNMVAKTINELAPKTVIFRYWTPFLAPCWNTIAKRLDSSIKKTAWVDNWKAHEPKPWDNFLTRQFEKSMDNFTTLSTAVATEIKADSVKKVWGKMHPVEEHLPKKLDPKEARTKLNFPQEKTALLFFGLIRPYKGLILLLKALKQHPEKHLFIVGECYEKWGKYQQLIKDLKIEKQITAINRFVSQEEAAIYFSAVDATILPYTSATQSGVLALGYFYETPLVVTNHPGLSQPITEDKTGVICPPKIARFKKNHSVTETKANQEFRNNLSQTKQRYSWENYAKEWAKFVLDETT